MAGLFDDIINAPQKRRKGLFDDIVGVEAKDPRYYMTPVEPEPEEPGLMRELGDTGLSVGKGALGAVESLTNLFGADNRASRGLRTGREYLGSLESEQQQAQRQEHSRRMQDAEAQGSWAEAKTAFKNFLEDPIDYSMEGLGSLATTAPLALVSKGSKILGMSSRTVGAGAVGGSMGVGAVKGQQYEMTRQALIEEGYSPEEAERRAVEHQSYNQDNTVDLLAGGLLGVAAGTTGAERFLLGGAPLAGKGLIKRGVIGAVTEAPMEAAQGGQERLAGNRALYREGYDVDPMTGVVGQGVSEGLMSGPVGGGLAMAQGYTPTEAEFIEQRRLEQQARMAEEQALQQSIAQAEEQQRAEIEARERAQIRAMYTEKLPFKQFQAERVQAKTDQLLTPDLIEEAYQNANAQAAGANPPQPPVDRAAFEKKLRKAVEKDVLETNQQGITDEYYQALDEFIARDEAFQLDQQQARKVGLQNDNLIREAEVQQRIEEHDANTYVNEFGQPLHPRRPVDAGTMPRADRPPTAPIPTDIHMEAEAASVPFTGVNYQRSFGTENVANHGGILGVPNAQERARMLVEQRAKEAEARKAKKAAKNAPKAAEPEVDNSAVLLARNAAKEAGVSDRAWALFVSKNQLVGADLDTVIEAVRSSKLGGDPETLAEDIRLLSQGITPSPLGKSPEQQMAEAKAQAETKVETKPAKQTSDLAGKFVMPTTGYESVEDETAPPTAEEQARMAEEDAQDAANAKVIETALKRIGDRAARVLTMYHFDKMTEEAIGERIAELEGRKEPFSRKTINKERTTAKKRILEIGKPFGLTEERYSKYFIDERKAMSGGSDVKTAGVAELMQMGTAMHVPGGVDVMPVGEDDVKGPSAEDVVETKDGEKIVRADAAARSLDIGAGQDDFNDPTATNAVDDDADATSYEMKFDDKAIRWTDSKGRAIPSDDIEWAAQDYNEDLMEGDVRFEDLPRKYQAQYVRAFVAWDRGETDGRVLMAVFQEILDANNATPESPASGAKEARSGVEGVPGQVQGADAGTSEAGQAEVKIPEVPKGTKITLEREVEGKTKRKQVDAKKALQLAQQRVEKLTQLRRCLG